MTCRKCMHEFCWLCKETWFHHTSAVHANCGQGKGKDGKGEQGKELTAKELAATKTELERYIFYYERYINHSKSRDICKK